MYVLMKYIYHSVNQERQGKISFSVNDKIRITFYV